MSDDAVRDIAAALRAMGLVMVNEAWVVEMPGVTTDEGVRAAVGRLPENLGEVPGRREEILALLMTHGWHELHHVPIHREGKAVSFGNDETTADDGLTKQYMIRYFEKFN